MPRLHNFLRTSVVFICCALLPWAAMADSYPQQNFPQQNIPQQNIAQQALSPDQLNNLVAPIALYPDPLLGQLLAASTYPLELVEAQQWLQQNRNLQGRALEDAARQQDWDPSVQVLAAFPDVVALLNRDVRWTTDLGNAFLAQQADVMNAIQTLRAQAQNNGRLASTPQQVVTDDVQNGQGIARCELSLPIRRLFILRYITRLMCGVRRHRDITRRFRILLRMDRAVMVLVTVLDRASISRDCFRLC